MIRSLVEPRGAARSCAVALSLLCALASPAGAFIVEPDVYASAASSDLSDLVVVARPVLLQRLRAGPSQAFELVTCEVERVLRGVPSCVGDSGAPRPRLCVFRQLESDEVHFERQVLVEGQAYVFVLRGLEPDACYSPCSSYHPFLPATDDVVARFQAALFGREGEPLDVAPLAEDAAVAHLRRVVADLRRRVEDLARRGDGDLLDLMNRDEVRDALYAGLAEDRRVGWVEPSARWPLRRDPQQYDGPYLEPYAPVQAVAPGSQADEAPFRSDAGTTFQRSSLTFHGLEPVATVCAVHTFPTARGEVSLRVHVKVGPGGVGVVAAGLDERPRRDGLPLDAWVARVGARAQAAALADVLAQEPGEDDEDATAVHEHAGRALADLGRAAVPPLVRLLDQSVGLDREDGGAAWRALETLGRMGPLAADAVPAVARLTRTAPGDVRGLAIETLGGIGVATDPALDALERALADPEDDVRVAAAGALERLGPGAARSVPHLARRLQDPYGGVGAVAAAALGAIGPAAAPATGPLVAALESRDARVVAAAASALPRVGVPAETVLPAYAAALERHPGGGPEDGEVWRAVCYAVVEYGAAAAPLLPRLRSAQEAGSEAVRSYAAYAVRAIEARVAAAGTAAPPR